MARRTLLSVLLYVPNIIGLVRVVLAIGAMALTACSMHRSSVVLYCLSSFLDALDGYAARLLNQSSHFGAALDMVTDRAATAMLLCTLSTRYPPALVFLFQLVLALDISSHYIQMLATNLSGKTSHKSVDTHTPGILRLYYSSRPILFLVCALNELYLIFLYVASFAPSSLVTTGIFITVPVFTLKQGIHVLQMYNASRILLRIDTSK